MTSTKKGGRECWVCSYRFEMELRVMNYDGTGFGHVVKTGIGAIGKDKAASAQGSSQDRSTRLSCYGIWNEGFATKGKGPWTNVWHMPLLHSTLNG